MDRWTNTQIREYSKNKPVFKRREHAGRENAATGQRVRPLQNCYHICTRN